MMQVTHIDNRRIFVIFLGVMCPLFVLILSIGIVYTSFFLVLLSLVGLLFISPFVFLIVVVVLAVPLFGLAPYLRISFEGTFFSLGGRTLTWLLSASIGSYLLVQRAKFSRFKGERYFRWFVIVLLVQSIHSVDWRTSVSGFMNVFFLYMLFLLSLYSIRNQRRWRTALCVLIISALFPIGLGIYQIWVPVHVFLERPVVGMLQTRIIRQGPYVMARISSFFHHPNVFGHYLTLVLFLAIAFLCDLHMSRKIKFLLVLSIVVGFICLAQTVVRGAIISLGVVLLAYSLAKGKRVLLVTTVFVIPAFFFGFGFVPIRFSQIGLQWATRTTLWTNILTGSPYLLFGSGTSTMDIVSPVRYQLGGVMAHNDYIKFLVETGVIGFCVYLTFILSFVVMAYRNYRRAPESEYGKFALIVFFAIGGYMMGSFVENLQEMGYLLPLYLLFALLITGERVWLGPYASGAEETAKQRGRMI